jgi:glyoxylase-like metal-dependent hydrolase (beta-lactamase superfamily II)
MIRASKGKLAVLTAFSLISILATIAWANWYKPIIRVGPRIASANYMLPAPVPGLRLHVINTSMNRMSWFAVGNVRPWRPNPVFVLEHPAQGLIVFDTGFSEQIAERGEFAVRFVIESIARRDRMIDEQMRGIGLDPSAVKFVIISHLHGDHTGRANAFPNAELVGGPATAAALADLAPSVPHRSIDFRSGTELPPFDASLDLFGDGSVTLLPGGGHTREDLMAMLALPGGPALLAGDAIVHRDWLDSDDVQRIAVDVDRAAVVRNQVRALVQGLPRLALFPGHDLPPEIQRDDIVIHAPDWFQLPGW